MYYGYRYYSPGLGRWLSRDPLGEFAGLSRYAYLANNPLGSFDYLGLLDERKVLEVLKKMQDCKASHPDAYNWDAGIEYLLKKAYGKNWKENIAKISEGLKKGLGYAEYLPEKYQDTKDLLDKLYPEGVPFETKGLLDADLTQVLDAFGKVTLAIDAVNLAVDAHGSSSLTGGDAVDLLSKVFDFSTQIAGGTPGVGSLLSFYSEAIKAAATGIRKIEDGLFAQESAMFLEQNCDCIDGGHSEMYRGVDGVMRNILKSLRKDSE